MFLHVFCPWDKVCTPTGSMHQKTDMREVRILLECILVFFQFFGRISRALSRNEDKVDETKQQAESIHSNDENKQEVEPTSSHDDVK